MIDRKNLIAATALSGYALWNLIFIVQGEIPPSLFKYVTKLPCPTSGGTRSLLHLLRGDIRESLLYNPFTIVYIALIMLSVFFIIRNLIFRKKFLMPSWMLFAWLGLLGVSWIVKFILPAEYW